MGDLIRRRGVRPLLAAQLVSALVIGLFVPARPPQQPADEGRGPACGRALPPTSPPARDARRHGAGRQHAEPDARRGAGPLVNAPLIGVITMRTPEALRAKVMTAVITFAMLAGPVGLFAAGPMLEAWGLHAVFALVAAGQLLASLGFATVACTRPRERAAGTTLAT